MKKKLAIVTISYGNNYGNKLQNYAMQEVYKKFNLDVKTIKFNPSINKKKKLILKIKNASFTNIINKLLKTINYKNYKKNYQNRINNFNLFNKKIDYTKDYYESNYMNIDEPFDYYSVGSDQVWNPYFADFSNYYLLDFVNDGTKIAYAPSFGVSNIPNDVFEYFKKCLAQFKSLSCRESDGGKIIKNLINKEVPIVVDPTMLLTSEDWQSIATLPDDLKNKKYVLTYFLGRISRKNKHLIKKYCKDNNYILINPLNIFSNSYSYGPDNFLGLISNAEAIFTDSFHASLFSIMFKKAFFVFERDEAGKSMSSRITTLLETFGLNDRKFKGNFDLLNKANYSNVDLILKLKREESFNYINKSLNK